MSVEFLIALACGAFVAYLNGANDVSKGIATLAGSGVTDYRRAILWGTLWTGLGGLASFAVSKGMIATFGAGLLAQDAVPTFTAALAVLLGVAAWVGVATRFSLPVSTTHAIVGSAVGVYSFSFGGGAVRWEAIGGKVVVPLLVSPLLALGLVAVMFYAQRLIAAKVKSSPECLCADVEPDAMPAGLVVTGGGLAFSQTAKLRMSVGSQDSCAKDRPGAIRLTSSQLHWLTSGATSFARGLNDTPKIVALVLVAGAFFAHPPALEPLAFAVLTMGMVAGSFVAGRRVTVLLAERVTPMDHQEGFLANLVTAAMVGPGAALGLPMSTTHVSSGAIIGLGFRKKVYTNWRTVQSMILAWVVTVPLAAALGIVSYALLGLLHAG